MLHELSLRAGTGKEFGLSGKEIGPWRENRENGAGAIPLRVFPVVRASVSGPGWNKGAFNASFCCPIDLRLRFG